MFITKLNDIFVKISGAAAAVIMAAITLAVGYQVFGRVVLRNTPSWTEELARMMTIWLVGFGATIGFRRGEHMGVTFVVDRFPKKVQNIVNIGVQALIMFYLVTFLKVGIDYVKVNRGQITPILRVEYNYFTIVILVCVVFMVFYALENLLKSIRSLKNGSVEEDNDDTKFREILDPAEAARLEEEELLKNAKNEAEAAEILSTIRGDNK